MPQHRHVSVVAALHHRGGDVSAVVECLDDQGTGERAEGAEPPAPSGVAETVLLGLVDHKGIFNEDEDVSIGEEEHLDKEGLSPIYDELYRKPEGVQPDEAVLARARTRLAEELDYFGRQLQGDFLAGAAPTAADFVLYPEIAYVKRIGAKKPASGLAGILPAPIAAWAARIEALPYFEKTFPPHWRS